MESTDGAWIGPLHGESFTMPKPPNYEEIEIKQWRKNAKEVVQNLEKKEKNVLKRIKTFIWRFGFPQEQVETKIADDEMFAAHFTKEPRRTGLHEREAAKWLGEQDHVDDFEVLPKSGENALYISNDGEIRQYINRPPSKSLDFRWKTGEFTIYASHKYTREGGGNQDSQYNEIAHLLEMFQRAQESEEIVLLAIVDGPYYTNNRMNELHRFCRDKPPISAALPIEVVPSFLSWLMREADNLLS